MRRGPVSSPSVTVVPVAGEGQASRANHTNASSSGAGSGSRLPRSCQIERHQPVAPVPLPTTNPDEAWRSVVPSGVVTR